MKCKEDSMKKYKTIEQTRYGHERGHPQYFKLQTSKGNFIFYEHSCLLSFLYWQGCLFDANKSVKSILMVFHIQKHFISYETIHRNVLFCCFCFLHFLNFSFYFFCIFNNICIFFFSLYNILNFYILCSFSSNL